MEEKIEFYGYKMTEGQEEELSELLKQDILDRYNNSEYWNDDIIENYVADNRLEKTKN